MIVVVVVVVGIVDISQKDPCFNTHLNGSS